ncbi:MAG: DNA mismatch repair endonuclease MutL [Christensenellaceae bacterium]|jgi:DNA mismatch repair protein MutL|nr:DNA mismatch repair endonuclease MutL [Christensenellaceae bacterium]
MIKKINVLPPAVFNLLSAGEVVENPSSVVKELAENSIDAGATRLEISITNGGIDEIVVADNGSGIAESEIGKVFLPHATSKIKTANDLDNIATLGFRGEALASIARVSKVKFGTKTDNAAERTQVFLDGGEVKDTVKTSGETGTTISIGNLFYNTPARRKFLKTPTSEKNSVTDTVHKIILANPSVKLRYIADGEVALDYKGGKLIDAIGCVFGKELKENMLEIVNDKQAKINISGFISKPSAARRNKTRQVVIVNDRVIDGGIIADAVNSGFSNYLMVGNFPCFVLNVSLDLTRVDVNVHPRKAEIRFDNENEVFEAVRAKVIETLDNYFESERAVPRSETIKEKIEAKTQPEITETPTQKPKFTGKSFGDNLGKMIKIFSGDNKEQAVKSAPNLMQRFAQMMTDDEPTPLVINFAEHSQTEIAETKNEIKILGNIFETYLLVFEGGELIIIDQHAGAERLAYDNLRAEIDKGTVAVQTLLAPIVLDLNPKEEEKLAKFLPFLAEIGIEIAEFGAGAWRITAVPVEIATRNIEEALKVLLSDKTTTTELKLSNFVKEKIIREVCHSSLRAGTSLNETQIRYFLDKFNDKKITPLCPHGRPILVALSRAKIEKMFGRTL